MATATIATHGSVAEPAARSVTILVANFTDEQLELDKESTHLSRGAWSQDTTTPTVIKPGGSVLWRCRSYSVGQGIEGSVTYHFAGEIPHDKARFTWKSRVFGPNKYDAVTSRKECKIAVEGGGGVHACVAFIVGE
ncbi:hypothetical protein GE09DRAFT_1288073 [Coniochaeta sp. 2T2.1]|nr:hypothetical protein GE09DRAFT_1288073 [Coniochaeta sp. 2T2.1]